MSELDDFLAQPWRSRPTNVYIGWDAREHQAFEVAWSTLIKTTSSERDPLRDPAFWWDIDNILPLDSKRLELQRILRRPIRRLPSGELWDEISESPMATEFANSRFLTPLLAQRGLALFVDCDVVFLGDCRELFAIAAGDPSKAVWVVKHGLRNDGTNYSSPLKMDGQAQTHYARKNWSSVMLFNCDHPSNLGLTLELVNSRPGRELHRFCWLDNHEIGTLPPEWNWLVGVQPKPKAPKIAHFTLGGPWLSNWRAAPYDDIWLDAQASVRPTG